MKKAKMINLAEGISNVDSQRFIKEKFQEINIERVVIVDKR